jgi:hypothetical protein
MNSNRNLPFFVLICFIFIFLFLFVISGFNSNAENQNKGNNAFKDIQSSKIKARNSNSIRQKLARIDSDIVDKDEIEINLFDGIK